jgi:hypothetical protein
MIRRKNVLSLDSVRKEDGRLFDRFYVIICTNAMKLQVQLIIYFLPVSSGFHFYTHAFRSLIRVFYALCTAHITPVTSHQYAPHHGYNAVAGLCGAGSHPLRRNRRPFQTKKEKVEKVKYCGFIHALRSLPDEGGDVQSLVPIGSVMWICIIAIS